MVMIGSASAEVVEQIEGYLSIMFRVFDGLNEDCNYFVEPCLFGLLAVLHFVPQVDWLFALKEFVDAAVDETSVQILERVLDVSRSAQLVPHPRFFHIALILFHYFWRIEYIAWICECIKDCISSLNA